MSTGDLRVYLASSLPIAPPWNGADKNLARALIEAAPSGVEYHYRGALDGAPWRNAIAPNLPTRLGTYLDLARQRPRYDLFHLIASLRGSWLTEQLLLALPIVRRVPMVITCPSGESVPLHLAKRAAATVTLSECGARRARLLGVQDVHRVAPGIDVTRFQPGSASAARATLGIGDRPAILFAGNHEPGGGLEQALAFLAQVKKRAPTTVLLLAMRARPEMDERALSRQTCRLAADFGVADSIVELGPTADMPLALNAAAAVVFQPLRLGLKADLPLMLLEALATGRSIVVSPLEPLIELAAGASPAVITAEPGDESAVDHVVRLLSDGAYAEACGRQARRLAEERCSVAAMAEAYGRIYRSVVERRASSMAAESNRRKILHLAFEDPRKPGHGGGSVRTAEIDRRLARDYDITVLTARYPGSRAWSEAGVRYEHAGIGRLGPRAALLTYFAALPLAVWRRRADLVVEDFAPPFTAAWAPVWTRKPVIAVVQYLFGRQKARQYHLPLGWIERLGVRRYRDFIAVSDAFANEIRAMNPRADVRVLRNGVDPIAGTVPVPRGRDMLFLGRIERDQKGLDLLLDAFARIAGETSANLLIAGDGPDSTAVERLAANLEIAPRVRLLGRVEGPPKFELLSSAQLLCMPSRYEGFPIVALEAMRCGTPVLGFAIPSMRESVGGGGVLVPPFDVDELSRAMRQMLADPHACEVMGEEARRQTAGLDWDRIAMEQDAVYRDVLTGRKGDSAARLRSTNA